MKYAQYIALCLLLLVAWRRSDRLTYNRHIKRLEYASVQRHGDIIFLGDSHISLGQWQSLLRRPDAGNEGYNGATSLSLIGPLQHVLAASPDTVYIMCGINNILQEYSRSYFLADISNMVTTLKGRGTTPIVHHILYVGRKYPNSRQVNATVIQWNKSLDSICKGEGVTVINLNSLLSPRGYLDHQYAQPDHIHLNTTAYRLWASML
ncbi:MAG TPA: GDSL-type esterase/lipase family protein [Flavipsychrobacter sp.]|nr:GDSL-type esterase/lipase family protein [Flavipsychrobacter sp.]